MIKHLLHRKFAAFEAEWDYPLDYARDLLELGVLVLKKFFDASAIGDYQGGISKHAWHAAKIIGVMDGDCGACAQLLVNMAMRDGVPAAALESLVSGEFDSLPVDMRLPASFARALVARADDLPELREQMREAHGTAGLVAVAYAVISASMFPTLKYALGHGHTCAKIEIGARQLIPASPMHAPRWSKLA